MFLKLDKRVLSTLDRFPTVAAVGVCGMSADVVQNTGMQRRRSFSRASKGDEPEPSEQMKVAKEQAKAKEERRKDAGRRFSLTGMVDLAEFANVDERLSP